MLCSSTYVPTPYSMLYQDGAPVAPFSVVFSQAK